MGGQCSLGWEEMSDFKESGKSFTEVFYEDDDGYGTLELHLTPQGEHALFVHCELYDWKPSILRKCRKEFEKLREECLKVDIDCLYTYTTNPRWCYMLGIQPLKIGEFYENSEKYEVLEWEL